MLQKYVVFQWAFTIEKWNFLQKKNCFFVQDWRVQHTGNILAETKTIKVNREIVLKMTCVRFYIIFPHTRFSENINAEFSTKSIRLYRQINRKDEKVKFTHDKRNEHTYKLYTLCNILHKNEDSENSNSTFKIVPWILATGKFESGTFANWRK